MFRHPRPRGLIRAALTVALAASSLVVTACQSHPNSIFHDRTDWNRDVGFLFDLLIVLGTIIFVFVEGILIYALIRFRRRGAPRQPEHVHGNSTLEIIWTIIPAVILVVIAIPTVRTIFRTGSSARADALQVEVIGHQWWWEFRYPQYTAPNPHGRTDTLITANELYLPLGRTVNFALKSQDVAHSFWVPSLAGKRDLIPNHVNYLWFTPDSTTAAAFNGFCVEFCGTSHANMRFRTFVVSPEQFQSWAGHQLSSAAFTLPAPTPPATPGGVAQTPQANPPVAPPGARIEPSRNLGQNAPVGSATGTKGTPAPSVGPPGAGVPATSGQPLPATQAGFTSWPHDSLPAYVIPNMPLPADIRFDDALQGDAARGADLLTRGQGACLGCHTIRGNPSMVGTIGPNLTHVATRSTIAGGLYPNDARHLARWIKNSRKMKPGVLMPTIGLNEYDPVVGTSMKVGLTDQQIADIVAYLQALK